MATPAIRAPISIDRPIQEPNPAMKAHQAIDMETTISGVLEIFSKIRRSRNLLRRNPADSRTMLFPRASATRERCGFVKLG